MKLNTDTAVSSAKILLVPYEPGHVPTYHNWMEDPVSTVTRYRSIGQATLEATASERLTLEEEYENQVSWRESSDKLTFIVCLHPTPQAPKLSHVTAGVVDSPNRMLGDINLFVVPQTIDGGVETTGVLELVGEVNVMIADPAHRGKGFGRAALSTFLFYVARNRSRIVKEYTAAARKDGGRWSAVFAQAKTFEMPFLVAKIHETNHASLALFKSMGFEPFPLEANWFGEFTLLRKFTDTSLANNAVAIKVPEGYTEVEYIRPGV